MGDKDNSRLSLAEQFFVLATGATEAAMRTSLSRLYYANFHVAAALTGRKSHGDVARQLSESYGDLGEKFKSFHNLRSQMDYTPDFFETLRSADPRRASDPTIWFQEKMREGIGLYLQLRGILEQAHR